MIAMMNLIKEEEKNKISQEIILNKKKVHSKEKKEK